jgi:hypothetical protein
VGHPIVGDRKYGAPAAMKDRSLALHSLVLAFKHPTKDEPVEAVADVPPSWDRYFGPEVRQVAMAAADRVLKEWRIGRVSLCG